VSAFAELQKRLAYNFRDENLLRLALTHPSVAHESGVASEHNQRLEFLGDAENFPRSMKAC
jgi:ribonuclease-3